MGRALGATVGRSAHPRGVYFSAVDRLKKIPPLLVALMLPATSLGQNASVAADAAPNSSNNCPAKSVVLNFDVYRFGELVGQVPIWHLRDDSAFFFAAGMTIDADGAPNAYNADNTGLDDLSNAGQPGHWDGLLQDEHGNPLVQGPDDPFPGYYISCTALADWTKDRFDPTRFVDASKVPYIALPGDLARETGARLGDLAVAFNLRNGRFSYAIFADIGALGEGSIALADSLGLWPDARRGGSRGGILYLVFPGSGNHQPKSDTEISERAAAVLQDWGGVEQLHSCADNPADYQGHWPAWPIWLMQATDPASKASAAKQESAAPAAKDHADTN